MSPRFLPLLYLCSATVLSAAEPTTLKIWPEGTPSPMVVKSEATAKLILSYGGPTATRITDVSDPTITIYRPEKPNGTSIVVAPGGGYMFLSYSFEGTEVCEWLNTLGVTAALLKYRVPTRDDKDPFTLPVQDAQKAVSIVREHAAEWSLDPKRVGLLGFSAGGNLTGHAAWDRPTMPEGKVNQVPDFIVFIYGGGFLDATDKTKFRAGFSVPADAPPAFFAVAHDDNANPIEATLLYLEYKKRNIPAEIHICTKGGHGFGMRRAGNPINDWPQRCAEWMKNTGWLAPKA